jgi:hypothetical protein
MAADVRYVWVYGVTDDHGTVAADMIGLGGSPVRTLSAAGLTAIIGDVSEREYGAAALRRNLEDLDWLDRTARAHHAVIGACGGQGPVVPMRLATVFASDAGVAGMLHERASDIQGAMSRISSRSEWGVKAYAVTPTDPRGPVPGPGAAGPGAVYLRRRRAQWTAQNDARREATAGARTVYAELSRLAVSARLYPPQSPDLVGQPAPMVLNAAYLVADERAGEFAAAVTDLTARHRFVRLALTGPWPAYSFVSEGAS